MIHRNFTLPTALHSIVATLLVGSAALVANVDAQTNSFAAGAAYTSTNSASGNAVAIYTRAVDGTVTFDQFVSTGGTGTGAGLGDQGAVVLSSNERWLYVVNAGSNTLSVFRVLDHGLQLVDEQRTGGRTPISVSQFGDLVYVVHSGSSSITGFRQGLDGKIAYLPNSRRPLSGVNVGAAQIAFSRDGRDLYVTEKATSSITQFRLDENGIPGLAFTTPSAGPTPFGFAFGFRDQLIVSEAHAGAAGAGTVSSYERQANGHIAPITASLADFQSAPCWIATTPDQRIAFTTNAASATVSSYRIAFDGQLTLLDATAALTDAGPTDMAITPDGKFFYVRNNAGSIGDYRIENSGALTPIPGTNNALPAGSAGLAVR